MRRWVSLLGCFIGMAMSMSSMLLFPFGLYMTAVTADFGWSRTQFSAALSSIALCNIVALPLAGWAVDAIGAVRCIVLGLIVGCLCYAGLALVNTYAAFVAVACAASVAGCLALYPAYFTVVRGWFDRNLGLALAVASAGVSVGVVGFSYLIKARIDAAGWRNAFVSVALVALLVGLANVLCLIRVNHGPIPEPERLHADEPGVIAGASLGEAVRTREYWMFSVAFMLVVFAGVGPSINLPALIADRGGAPALAATAIAAIALGSLIGRMITGFLLDRYSVTLAATLFFVGQAVGIAALSANINWTVAAAFLMGMAQGAELDIMGFVMARGFGRRFYARIFGSSFALSQLGLIFSPILTAAIFDRTRSYDLALLSFPVLSVVASFLILRANALVRTAEAVSVSEAKVSLLPRS